MKNNLPENWTETTLNDVAEYINGRAFKPSEWETEGVPIVRIQNLNDYNAPFNYSTKSYEDIFKIKNGDLLFAWAASLGAYIWRGEIAWLNQHIFKVIPKIDKDFLFYSLSFKVKELYSKSHGSGMVHITKGAFLESLIPLPPLAEQGRIVAKIEELFAGIDAGVENLKAVKNQIARYRQSVLKSAFDNQTKKEMLKNFIIEINYGTSEKTNDDASGIPVLRMGDIQNGKLRFNKLKYLKKITDKKLLLQKGDLLFNRTNSAELVGKSAVFNSDFVCSFASYLIKVRFSEKLNSDYVCFYINSPYGKAWAKTQLTQQVGQANINSQKLQALQIPVPTLAEQERIVAEIESRFERADALETAVDRALNDAEKLKQAVLKKAFSGELVPQNPDDEPASVLLDRIRAARASELPAKKGKRKKTEVDSQL